MSTVFEKISGFSVKADPQDISERGVLRGRALCTDAVSPDAGQILDDLSGDDKAYRGRDKGVAAGNLPPLGAFPGGAGRADAVGAAADGHVVDGGQGELLGIDHLKAFDLPLF